MPATTYEQVEADAVVALVRDGMTLPKACERVGVPRSTFLDWVDADRDGLSGRYARARQRLLDHWADEVVEIADDGGCDRIEGDRGPVVDHDHINRSRLRVDTRKWLLSKLRPEQYGDKSTQSIDLTLKGEDPASVLAARRKAREGE
jgi:hypothetical protein